MTPATLGPIACMSRKLVGLARWPSFWETRAAIGTADTPAEPMSGLILPPESLYISLPSSSPPTVANSKAMSPSTTMKMVCQVRKRSKRAVAPTEVERKMVTMFIMAFCAVSERRSVRPDSLKRLPSMRQPSSGATEGRSRQTNTVTMMGKRTFSVLLTGRSCSILHSRSSLVVRSLITGGWMRGMSAM